MPQRRTRQRKRGSSNPERIAAIRKQHTLLLALLVLIVFASTLAGGFVWSDREDLLQGAHRIDSVADIGAVTRDAAGIDALENGSPVPWPHFDVDEITRLFG